MVVVRWVNNDDDEVITLSEDEVGLLDLLVKYLSGKGRADQTLRCFSKWTLDYGDLGFLEEPLHFG